MKPLPTVCMFRPQERDERENSSVNKVFTSSCAMTTIQIEGCTTRLDDNAAIEFWHKSMCYDYDVD